MDLCGRKIKFALTYRIFKVSERIMIHYLVPNKCITSKALRIELLKSLVRYPGRPLQRLMFPRKTADMCAGRNTDRDRRHT